MPTADIILTVNGIPVETPDLTLRSTIDFLLPLNAGDVIQFVSQQDVGTLGQAAVTLVKVA